MIIAGAMRHTHPINRAVCERVWFTRLRTREDIVMDRIDTVGIAKGIFPEIIIEPTSRAFSATTSASAVCGCYSLQHAPSHADIAI